MSLKEAVWRAWLPARVRVHTSACSPDIRVLAVTIAAFVVSIVALLAAGWSAWSTHRQARAAEVQAEAADAANRTAQEALTLARAADSREQTRQHVEQRPHFNVVGKRVKNKPLLTMVTIKNEGPLSYESITVRLDLEDAGTNRLVRGIGRLDAFAAENTFSDVKSGETVTMTLVRADPQLGGQAKLLVTAKRAEGEWTMIHYVQVSRPPRIISV